MTKYTNFFFGKIFRITLYLFITISILSCSQDDITIKGDENQKETSHRTIQEEDAYQKALKKLPSLYSFVNSGKKRMSTGDAMPPIEDAYPLWYGDTAIVTPGIDPGAGNEAGDDSLTPKDSIYAYIFDFAYNAGSIVVGVDENLPDLMVYSVGHNFIEEPFYINKKGGITNLGWYLRIAQIYANREALIRKMMADFSNTYLETTAILKEKYFHSLEEYEKTNAEWGDENYKIPKVIRGEFTTWDITRSQKYKTGKCILHLLDTLPYTKDLIMNNPYNTGTKCWDIIPAVAMYMSCMQDVSTYNDWSIDWKTMFETKDFGDDESPETLDQISYLYYLLGLPNNINWHQDRQERDVMKNIPRTLENFGFTNGGEVRDNMTLNEIIQELDSHDVCLVMSHFKPLASLIKKEGLWSVLIDDYRERECKGTYFYQDNHNIERTYKEWFLSIKFTGFETVLSEVYWNWSLLNPNYSVAMMHFQNPRAPILFPVGDPSYDNLSVLMNVQP